MRIKSIVKKNKFLSALAYCARKHRNMALMKKYESLPLDPNKVVLYRSGGGYGDNPRAVAEYIHRHRPNIKLVWAYGTPGDKMTIPGYILPVAFESDVFLREMATAAAWVCSTTLPDGTIKRKGQIYIQTWHGDKGFKKFGRDAVELDSIKKSTHGRRLIESEICDYFLTGAKWFIPKIRSAIGFNGEIIGCGLPRNDCLVNPDPKVAIATKRRIGIAENTKTLIYAPTFRDHEGTHEVVASDIDLSAILNALEKKTGEQWICLLKAHAGRKLKLAISGEKTKFIDVTAYPDIADLLMISDMLITDYSSCAGDFALTDRFILLYQDDIESYTTKDRTLYFDMKDTPYYVAHNLDEAVKIIDEVDTDAIVKNCAAIRKFYGVCETGRACEEVVNLILENKARLEREG